MKIITISRQYGAGGREIGLAVGKELGVTLYDRDIIAATAKASSIDASQIEHIVDDAQQRVPGAHRDVGQPPLLGVEVSGLQQFRRTQQAVQRRAHLMAHDREKARFRDAGLFGGLARALQFVGLRLQFLRALLERVDESARRAHGRAHARAQPFGDQPRQ